MSSLSPGLRSVYILGDGLLFDEIIAHMLALDPNLRVVKRVYRNEDVFLTDISWWRPDVVLLNETNRLDSKHVLALLPRLLLPAPVRVIVMSLKNNQIQVYDQPADQPNRRIAIPYTLKRLSDWKELFDIIEGKQLIGH